jgi:hypothetical protein
MTPETHLTYGVTARPDMAGEAQLPCFLTRPITCRSCQQRYQYMQELVLDSIRMATYSEDQ